jgi:hypothetical protein
MISSMSEREDIARLNGEQIRGQAAIRRRLSAMAAEEREMERAMKAFEEDADQAKRFIEAEWRTEHWGHDPEHPPAWETADTTHGPLVSRHSRRA